MIAPSVIRFVLHTSSLLLLAVNLNAQSALKILPSKPRPGQEILLEYDPAFTPLRAISDFEAVGYLLEDELPTAIPIRLIKTGKKYSGRIRTTAAAKAIFFTFRKDRVKDNNTDDIGYTTPLYTPAGMPVPGAYLESANVYSKYGDIWGLKRHPAMANKLIRQEIAALEKVGKRNPVEYLRLLSLTTEDSLRSLLPAETMRLLRDPEISEATLTDLRKLLSSSIRDKDGLAIADSLLKSRFPGGDWQRENELNAIYRENDPAKKDSAFLLYQQRYPAKNAAETKIASDLSYSIALYYAESGRLKDAIRWSDKIAFDDFKPTVYYVIALSQSGMLTNGVTGDVKTGLQYAERSLSALDRNTTNLTGKAKFRTESEFFALQAQTRESYLQPYALLLYHDGQHKKAYEIQHALVNKNKGNAILMNEALTLMANRYPGPDTAQKLIEEFVKRSRSTPKMISQLKEIFQQKQKAAGEWENYLAGLEASGRSLKTSELKERLTSYPAPAFSLRDLEGKTVSLASLKGKIIVADFWATWCGPCKVSFPAMSKAVRKYKSDDRVKFIFIDTWEKTEQPELSKKIAAYMSENKFDFHVLLDSDSKVIEAFGVNAIPTKFVIDGEGKIRFSSTGFEGTDESLVDELVMMIEMLM